MPREPGCTCACPCAICSGSRPPWWLFWSVVCTTVPLALYVGAEAERAGLRRHEPPPLCQWLAPAGGDPVRTASQGVEVLRRTDPPAGALWPAGALGLLLGASPAWAAPAAPRVIPWDEIGWGALGVVTSIAGIFLLLYVICLAFARPGSDHSKDKHHD